MTNKKGTPRFNTKKPEQKYYLVNHPEHGAMIYNNGWLKKFNRIEHDKIDGVEPFREEMRVAGEHKYSGNSNDKQRRARCSKCGKKKLISSFVDGKCAPCYRAHEDLDNEIKQLRHEWKWGSDSPHNVGNNGANWG